MLPWVLLACIAVYSALATLAAVRFARRSLALDEIINIVADDLETNLAFFTKLGETPMLSNAPEIVEAAKGIKIMAMRFDEIITQVEERTGKPVRKKTIPPEPTPVVVD